MASRQSAKQRQQQQREIRSNRESALETISGAVRYVGDRYQETSKAIHDAIPEEITSVINPIVDPLYETATNLYSKTPMGMAEEGAVQLGKNIGATTGNQNFGALTGLLLGAVIPGPGELTTVKGSMRLAARKGGRGKFLEQGEYDVVRPDRINAVRDKLDEKRQIIQNVEEANPGVSVKELKLKNREYKRAKNDAEDLEALLSSEESNIIAPKPGAEWAYPPNMPRAKEMKLAEVELRKSVEVFELHHLIPKGMSAAMLNRVRDFIQKGEATPEDLKRFALRPKELGLPDIGDLESNLNPMSSVPHNRFHTEMRYQKSAHFKGEALEISKQKLASKLSKVKTFKELQALWDEMLQGDIKYLVETNKVWEPLDKEIRSVSPSYTGTAKYKPKK